MEETLEKSNAFTITAMEETNAFQSETMTGHDVRMASLAARIDEETRNFS